MRIKYIPVDMDNVTDFSHSPNSNFLSLSLFLNSCAQLWVTSNSGTISIYVFS